MGTIRFGFVLMLLAAGKLGAQAASTGTLQGRVLGADSAAIVGATIRVTRAEVGVGRDGLTDPNGGFRIGFLVPGDYRISVRRIGYRPTSIERVSVMAGAVTRLTISLEAAAQGRIADQLG